MIKQQFRLATAIVVAGLVCACSNAGVPPLTDANARSMATTLHPHGVTEIGKFGIALGVAVDSNTHDVYVTAIQSGLTKIAPSGSMTNILPASDSPDAVAVDSNTHDVYVGEQDGRSLVKITPNGVKTVFAQPNGDSRYRGVAVDPFTHNVYLTYDWTFAKTRRFGAKKLAPNGDFAGCVTGRHFPAVEKGWFCFDTDLFLPWGVAADPTGISGWVYISDWGHNEIKRVDDKGVVTILGSSKDFRGPRGVAMDKTRDAFVADSGHNEVKEIFRPCSCVTASWKFDGPQGVAIDAGTGGGLKRSDFYVAASDGLWKVTP